MKQRKFDTIIKKALKKWVYNQITAETISEIRTSLKKSISELNTSDDFSARIGDVMYNNDEGLVVFAQYTDSEGTYMVTYSLKPSVSYVLVPPSDEITIDEPGKKLVLEKKGWV